MEENYNLVRPEVVEYVKTEIFPRYKKLKGHGLQHIQNVIRRSLVFVRRINEGEIAADTDGEIDYDMVFVIAAYHDLGREQNDALHHLVSAGMLLLDKNLWGMFDKVQLRIMADAVMDHRASNAFDPATIYGRIVSSADRDTDWQVIVKRAYAYNRGKYPEKTPDEALEVVREKLWIKFGAPDAYGAKKMFFDNPEYYEMIRKFHEITKESSRFREAVEGLIELV
ncbi:phosphohydrolase [Candidatus Saccharibacteria bacterium]|nr:phosphohydrolase [Candidatus Saccharibacteria bacterium]